MKKNLLLLILILFSSIVYSQNDFWEVAKGPYAGGYGTLTKTANGEMFYSINTKFNYLSFDEGNTWEKLPILSSGILNVQESAYIGNAGSLFLWHFSGSFGKKQWHKSTDDGQTWQPFDSTFISLAETATGAIIGITYKGIYRSTDGGNTWQAASAITPGNVSISINAAGEMIVLRETYEVIKSIDDGVTWISNPIEPMENYFYLSPALTFGILNDTLYRSEDGGEHFTSTMLPGFLTANFSTLNTGRILAQQSAYNTGSFNSGSNSLLYSDNEGLTWDTLTTSFEGAGGFFTNTPPLADGTIFKLHQDCILRSQDGGLNWSFSATGIRYGHTFEVASRSDSNFYAQTYYGLWKTMDRGETWSPITKNKYSLGNNYNRFDLLPNGQILCIQNNLLYLFDESSGVLTNISPSISLKQAAVFYNPHTNQIFTNTINGLVSSTDFGQTWTTNYPEQALDMAFSPQGRIITLFNSSISISDDNGTTWQATSESGGIIFRASFILLAPNGVVYLCKSGPNVRVLMKSYDLGSTWIETSAYTPAIQNIIRLPNGFLLLADAFEGLLLSTNEAQSWQTFPIPLDESNLERLEFIAQFPDQTIYASTNQQLYRSKKSFVEGAYIEGHVKIDADADCSTADAQAPFSNQNLVAQKEDLLYYTTTDSNGYYTLFVDTGSYQVIVQNPNDVWWDYCQDTIAAQLPDLFGIDTIDFTAITRSFCPLMVVDVAAPWLRRCFDNTLYVNYCNQGAEPADSAWVDISLDPELLFISSSQPHEILPNNTIRFFVGNIPSGNCGLFQLTVNVDCNNTVLGQTHCVTAHGFPDTLCTTVPDWSGANLVASVTCQDTIIQLKLKNEGIAPSQLLDYIIVVDEVVMMSGQRDYDIADQLVLEFPPNGNTWRIESEQEPGHPFSNLALAFAEGCGGFNSLGYINQFPVNGIQPSWHRMCLENIGAFDPNDKQGFPNGVGTEHNIRPGQDLDYLIRFQNTGTDTAFTVVIKDTLSAFLDPGSIRPGAGSHAYTWNLSGQGVISFTFNNIMLPDSNVNEPLSHGFVQFNISPYADIPLGSVIENDAAIYFDFNTPIITNTTWHTLAKSPLTSAVRPEPQRPEAGLDIWPNPFIENTSIHLDPKVTGQTNLKLFDGLGNLVFQKSSSGTVIPLNFTQLPAGLYWAELRDKKGGLIGREKIVKQ
jgi:uncharacterized repeat protein (TIGR01451 family)